MRGKQRRRHDNSARIKHKGDFGRAGGLASGLPDMGGMRVLAYTRKQNRSRAETGENLRWKLACAQRIGGEPSLAGCTVPHNDAALLDLRCITNHLWRVSAVFGSPYTRRRMPTNRGALPQFASRAGVLEEPVQQMD